MSKQQELDKLLATLKAIRARAELALAASDLDRAERYSQKAHKLAQKCQALQLEIEIGEMENVN